MRVIEKTGKTKDEALELALKEAGIEKSDDIQYEVDESGQKSGFLGIGGNKNVKVKLFLYDDAEDKVVKILKDILSYMEIKVDDIVVKKMDDDRLYIDIVTDETGILIGKHGKTLESIQLIVSLMANKNSENRVNILLDTGNYRDKRENTLKELARNIASKVKRSRKPYMLEPMNPYERKVIHSALQEEQGIEAVSLGNGIYKKMKINIKQ